MGERATSDYLREALLKEFVSGCLMKSADACQCFSNKVQPKPISLKKKRGNKTDLY